MDRIHPSESRRAPSIVIFGRRVPLWALGLLIPALSVLAYSPYLELGFAGDDFILVSIMEGAVPHDPLRGMWNGDMKSYPAFTALWWAESGVQGAFLRPVPSWTLTLLYVLFGRNALPFHLASALIHGLAAFTTFLVLRRLSRRNGVSLLAALLFLICEDHGMTVAWISTITDLMCLAFLNLALLCHISAREDGKPWLFGLSLGLALAAAASKESAVIYPAIVAAYELAFADGPHPGWGRLDLKARVRVALGRWWSWGLPLALFACYVAFYRAVVSPMNNLIYRDPLSEPFSYIAKAAMNLPVMFVGLLTPVLPSVVTFVPGTMPMIAGGGTVLTILLLRALLPYGRRRTIWFSMAVFVMGLLPGLATDPGERLLYFPSAYGMFFVAWLLVQIRPLRARLVPDASAGVRILGPLWGWYLSIAAVVVPVVLLFIYPPMWIEGLRLPERTVLRSMPEIKKGDYEHVVYLNTNSSFNSFYLKDIYRFYRGRYIDMYLLSSFNGRVWAKRESENTLALKTDDVGWLSNFFARIVRAEPELSTGYRREGELFTAVVLETTEDGKDILKARFEFETSLDDSALLLLCYDGRDYKRWQPSSQWTLLNATNHSYGP